MPRRKSDSPTLSSSLPTGPDFSIERALLEKGHRLVAGIDEAGRGPLAGPVVAAAVMLDPANVPFGLDDSKKLSPAVRDRLFGEILAASTVALGSASPAEIDRLNIRQATLLAMGRAVDGLAIRPDHCLVDGNDVPRPIAAFASYVIGGDARSLSIAAASIVAKVTRDRMMTRLGAFFPVYGFARHMGYGTKAHLSAIAAHGPCPHHRHSFAPLRQRSLAVPEQTKAAEPQGSAASTNPETKGAISAGAGGSRRETGR